MRNATNRRRLHMSGIRLMAHMEEDTWTGHGSDGIALDDSVRTTLTFSKNTKGKSLELEEHQNCLWFAVVGTTSPL